MAKLGDILTLEEVASVRRAPVVNSGVPLTGQSANPTPQGLGVQNAGAPAQVSSTAPRPAPPVNVPSGSFVQSAKPTTNATSQQFNNQLTGTKAQQQPPPLPKPKPGVANSPASSFMSYTKPGQIAQPNVVGQKPGAMAQMAAKPTITGGAKQFQPQPPPLPAEQAGGQPQANPAQAQQQTAQFAQALNILQQAGLDTNTIAQIKKLLSN